MAVAACLLLMLSGITAGQATPIALSLATARQDVYFDERATDRAWLYNDRNKTPSFNRDAAELDEVLDKRTNSRPSSQRHSSPHVQGTALQQVTLNHTPQIAPPAPHIQGGPDGSKSTPSHVPAEVPSADGPSAPPTERGSLNMMYYKVDKRPRGSLKHNPDLKALAAREDYARTMKRIKDGVLINKKKSDGSEYAVTNMEKFLARKRDSTRRSRRNRTEEAKAKVHQQITESARRIRAKRKAQREAEREGRTWQGSPVRKPGRPRKNWDQEREGTEEARQHAPYHLVVEKDTQRAVDVPHAPPTTLSPRPPKSSSGSWTVLESLHGASHPRFAPGTSSSSLDLDLSLSAPGSSTPGERQATRAPQAAPLAATREEERLRLTLTPPEHD